MSQINYKTENSEFINGFDSDDYDTDAMRIDDDNGNFSRENFEDYLKSNIVIASLDNGQFEQARRQCERFGFSYPEAKQSWSRKA